ncbi:MAG: radical SAM protein [Candidatus Odinarchaeia archaeon]
MKIIYGPVPSWRFGRSLGVDATTEPKKCTFNCIYCQLRRTKVNVNEPEKLQNELPTPKQVEVALKEYLKKLNINAIDFVTISGTGEPTINLRLKEIAVKIKKLIGNKPLGILTNSSLLPRDDVRDALKQFDFISAKLDAGDEKTFKSINRPFKGVYSFQKILNSIKETRNDVKGTFALETMLLKTTTGISNASGEPLRNLIEKIQEINPDIVQLYTPWRPSTEKIVLPLSTSEINKISSKLAEKLGSEKIWAYGEHDARGKAVSWKEKVNTKEMVVELLKRRPCRVLDISLTLNLTLGAVLEVLNGLDKNSLKQKKVNNEIFYQI